MTITTIITTYHRPALLKRAIMSVLEQTYSDFQLCIYDNGSDDETKELVHMFTKTDCRIKYHRHVKNIGMMPNYQFAIERLDSNFFSLLSDDDYLLPNFFKTALEAFKQFPDAAFSACGVAQMDERGNLIGDPLALWKSEGYYTASEGLIEMLKTRHRFPIPAGILFNKNVIKDIHPNFSDEIDFFWDPDYLLRIQAHFPSVITKTQCAVYTAHTGNYSCSFYQKFLEDFTKGEKYLKAMRTVRKGIEECQALNPFHRKTAVKLFNQYVKQDTASFMRSYIFNHRFRGAHFFAGKYYRTFGFSPLIIFYHAAAITLKFLTILKKLREKFFTQTAYTHQKF